MKTFQARTRLRGEIDYYKATWTKDNNLRSGYRVHFDEGPHKGERHGADFCAIAKDEEYLLGNKEG